MKIVQTSDSLCFFHHLTLNTVYFNQVNPLNRMLQIGFMYIQLWWDHPSGVFIGCLGLQHPWWIELDLLF